MPVTVNLFAAARAAAGRSKLQVAAGTLEQVRAQLADVSPELARLLPICSLLVDGTHPRDQIADGAVLDVLPPFAGG